MNGVTKQSIGWFEGEFEFDQYLEERAKRDSKFVNPLEESQGEEEEVASEFSFSQEDNQREEWDQGEA